MGAIRPTAVATEVFTIDFFAYLEQFRASQFFLLQSGEYYFQT